MNTRKIRKHLTYANVVATIALLIALTGGTAFAIKGKFGPKNLKANAVTTPKLAPGAVTAQKIAGGAVVGGSIADGAVASRHLAAGTLDGLDASCPGTLTTFAGMCMSASNIGPNGWQTSNRFCANAGLVLPDAGEAMTVARNIVAGTQIWTSDLVGDGSSGVVITAATVDPVHSVEPVANNNFARCVSPLTD